MTGSVDFSLLKGYPNWPFRCLGFGIAWKQLWDVLKTLGQILDNFEAPLGPHLDYWQSIPLPRGQHMTIFVHDYGIALHTDFAHHLIPGIHLSGAFVL